MKLLKENLFLLTLVVSIILCLLIFLSNTHQNESTNYMLVGYKFDADFIKNIGYAFLAPFGVYGAYIAGNRWKNDSKKLENDREQLDNTMFSGAITHLGHEQKSVRMGGVYTLIELAKKNENYKHKIFEVLNYHIVSQSNHDYKGHQKKEEYRISNELQTIFDLLFENEQNVECFKDLEANLANAKLQGVTIRIAFLLQSNLGGIIVSNNLIEQIESRYNLKLEPLPKNELRQYKRNEVILAVGGNDNTEEFEKLGHFNKLSKLTEDFINQEGINFYKAEEVKEILEKNIKKNKTTKI